MYPKELYVQAHNNQQGGTNLQPGNNYQNSGNNYQQPGNSFQQNNPGNNFQGNQGKVFLPEDKIMCSNYKQFIYRKVLYT